MKKILGIGLIMAMTLTCLVGCGGGTDTPPATDPNTPAGNQDTPNTGKEKFVLGLDDSFPPMGFRDEKNNLVGFDIDVAQAICDKLDMELVAQPIDWAAKDMELESGNIDCIWNGLTITPDRQEAYLLSRPYLANNQIICVRPDSGIKTKADLEGKIVGMQSGSSAEEAFNKDAIAGKVKSVLPYKDNVTALLDLKTAGVDAVILDEVVANYYTTLEPESYSVLSESLAKEEYAIAFKKGNQELHDKIMGAFEDLAKDGTLTKISEKWFSKDIVLK